LGDRLWCFGGDFNVVRFPSERSGAGGFSATMEEFLEFIHRQSLVDIPLQGGQFTWSNKQVWSKIDRFLLSLEWEEHYPNVSQSRLPRLLSDHFTLMLDCGAQREGK
jgi:endonuclease/exonuclease/phosphatase family metal-dependent hydrolase